MHPSSPEPRLITTPHHSQTSELSVAALFAFFLFNHLFWAEGARGDRHSYSWLWRGSHISERALKCLQSRASTHSFTKGQKQLTPHFLADKQPGGNGFWGHQGTVAVTCPTALKDAKQVTKSWQWAEGGDNKTKVIEETRGLTYRKPGSPLRTSKGACMPPVWARSMSRWSFRPARWK